MNRRTGRVTSTRRRAARAALARRRTRNRWIAIGTVAAAALVVLALLLVRAPAPPPVAAAGDPFLGREDAPVSVFYFADFQCPFCREFDVDGGLDDIRTRYVDGGRARVVFKDFPILGDDSWTAAEASQFVWTTAPDAYWSWHRAVFAAQGPERSGWASASGLVAITRGVAGVDADALADALRSGSYRDEVRGDKREGEGAGVRGTPTVVVDGRVANALDAAQVRRLIDASGGASS